MHSAAPAAMTVKPSRACPVCGIMKTSNTDRKISAMRSCCVRGGSWFKKCGDAGNSAFAHTWFEGFEACKGEFQIVKYRYL